MRSRWSRFVTPDPSSSWLVRLVPFFVLIFIGLLIFAGVGATWEYTNSSKFCGTTCHTMPPSYASYQTSVHAKINCVECHIGRGLIATQFTRKAGDLSHVIRFIGADYEVPIHSKGLRPASQVCERCHNPEKFSDDAQRTIKHYDAEQNNDLLETYMTFNIGGGVHTEGLGIGSHWHIENKVEYIATDDPHMQQDIPWVKVTYADGSGSDEFVDVTVDLPADFASQNADQIKTVDCAVCHNRVAHPYPSPSESLDDAMARGLVSPEIPYYKKNALEVMERSYPSKEEARKAIEGLQPYYQEHWPGYYKDNEDKIAQSVQNTTDIYDRIFFPDMAVDWNTYPDNLGHQSWAGCFRCHDGKHLNQENESIPLKCSLCHDVPVRSRPDGTTPLITVKPTFSPPSHADSNWVSRHRFEFDGTCAGCHDVPDLSEVNDLGSFQFDNTTFCANSACHTSELKYTGLDAPEIIELTNVLDPSLPTYPETDLTWNALIGPILESRCVACHGAEALDGGLSLASYDEAMAGGDQGAVILPGNSAESLLITVQEEGHLNQLPSSVLDWVAQWIDAGAPEE